MVEYSFSKMLDGAPKAEAEQQLRLGSPCITAKAIGLRMVARWLEAKRPRLQRRHPTGAPPPPPPPLKP